MNTILYTEISWINEIYDIDKCKEWTEHAKIVQAEVSLLLLAFINLVLGEGGGLFSKIYFIVAHSPECCAFPN